MSTLYYCCTCVYECTKRPKTLFYCATKRQNQTKKRDIIVQLSTSVYLYEYHQKKLTFVVVKCVLRDVAEGALEHGKAGVTVAVGRVVLHGSVVARAVKHEAVLSVVVHHVVLDAHMVAPFRGDCFFFWGGGGAGVGERGEGVGLVVIFRFLMRFARKN